MNFTEISTDSKTDIIKDMEAYLTANEHTSVKEASATQLYHAVSQAVMKHIWDSWQQPPQGKRACYFSAEFLMGRLVYNNLMNIGLLGEFTNYLKEQGVSPEILEEIEDDALGNGGLGRLAACFLDSGAATGIALDGYGIRYQYGLFKQSFEQGFQKEEPDEWLKFGDPWSVRNEKDTKTITFGGQTVLAVPYDMPVIGYGGDTINTLRLWQAEPVHTFDFNAFNNQEYDKAMAESNRALAISQVLYPNDDTDEGKRLRLKQQYFFSSASLQSILNEYCMQYGEDMIGLLGEKVAIQLNDTHPVVSIPELLRLLMSGYGWSFEEGFDVIKKVFSYTNHTVMSEALETWSVSLFTAVLPEVYPYVVMIQNQLMRTLKNQGIEKDAAKPFYIIRDGAVHMAELAIFASHSVNGVAAIHTEILKQRVFKRWYDLYPKRFQNRTNGITQRRWLGLCNRELSAFINEKIGNGWLKDLSQLNQLLPYLEEEPALRKFMNIKREKKIQLISHIEKQEGITLNPDFIFDIQVKRIHEYKRQLLNAFSILDLYFAIKDKKLKDFTPTVFLFGGKAAPGYFRAKGIIKYINEISRMLMNDAETRDRLQVLFVQNYNVSYAEKLIPAADFSQQISTAGTEASGTGNMKFMLNGAVTMGTLDGANIEIVEQAGMENNYIFGADVEEIESLKNCYDPNSLYHSNPRIKRIVDTLVDGTFDDGGSGMFRGLYNSLLKGASWHRPDQYFLLHDLIPYCEIRLKANQEYGDRLTFARKCLTNIAKAGIFSSDRTILEYAKDTWNL